MKASHLFLISFVVVGFTKCKCKDKPEPTEPEVKRVEVIVQPVYNGNTLYLDSVYTTPEGYAVKFTDIKFIAQDIQLDTQVKDAALFDYRTTGTALFLAPVESAPTTALSANLGVEVSVNHSDPSAFPNESVLNISNVGDMHWGWSSGYIFMKVEAKVDTLQDGSALFDHNVVFHIGKDENMKTLSFTGVNWQTPGENKYLLPLKLDMYNFLQNGTSVIDLKTEYSSHTAAGQEALSAKVIENFKASITTF